MAKTDKQATGTVAEETSVNAWRISASKGTRYELRDTDEHFMCEAIKPGDAMLLMDETGDNAWGVRRVFLVRRTAEGSVVYFDREFAFVDQPITFVGDGDKRVLRRIDLDVVDTVLNCVHPWGEDSLRTTEMISGGATTEGFFRRRTSILAISCPNEVRS